MYLYTTFQVRGHVFVYYGSSERSCICIVRFKWSVIYFYTTVQVISHVFACYGSSDLSCICILRSSDQSCSCILRSSKRSCICLLRFKWAVMYFYSAVLVISHIFEFCVIAFVSPSDFSIGLWNYSTVWYFNFCFSFYQLLCLVYMYCIMIYFSDKIPLSLWK